MCSQATIIVLAALFVGTAFSQSLPDCFLSMGDWGGVNVNVADMGQNMQRVINSPSDYGCSNVSFVFALGDNFYPTGVDSVNDPQWDSIFVSQFRALPAFTEMPVYAVVGDHDYNQLNPQDQPNHTKAMAQVNYHLEKDPLWILPSTNYSFTKTFNRGAQKVLFIVMDTEALYTCLRLKASWCFLNNQDQWVDSLLSKADNDATITAAVIVGHHAVVCPLGGHYDPFIDDVLVPIGRRHRVSLFLTAHSHFLAWSQESDLTEGAFNSGEMWYIINGAGRGAGPYDCYWNGLNFRVAKPIDKKCFPYELSVAGAFMIHKVTPTGFDHCVVASTNGTVVQCQFASYRASTPSLPL